MRAGRRDVPLTHPDKVLFPDDAITKADLAAYYRDAAPRMVPLVRDRPVSLQRFNAGIGRAGFFQKNVERGAPPWVKRVQVGKRGGSLWHVLANDAATLVWLANQNCITPHVWLSRADRMERPDRMIFDLDPPSDDEFALVRRTARELGDILREAGVEPFAMTTGSKGIHVVVALQRRHALRCGPRRGGRRRDRARRAAAEGPDDRVLQAQARGAAVRRRQPQRVRGDRGPGLRGAPAARRAGGHAAALGRALRPAPERAALDDAHRARARSRRVGGAARRGGRAAARSDRARPAHPASLARRFAGVRAPHARSLRSSATAACSTVVPSGCWALGSIW